MSWARVDDGWWCHAKVATLSLAARGLWVTALSWCAQQRRSDVPRAVLPMLTVGDRKAAELAAELAASGLWETSAEGWVFHHHEEYQRKEREKPTASQRSEHAAKAARARWSGCSADAPSMQGASAEHAGSNAHAMPDDAHAECSSMPPDPIPIPIPDPPIAPPPGGPTLMLEPAEPPQTKRTRSGPTTIPADWHPGQEVIDEIAKTHGVSPDDIAYQVEDFRAYWLSGGGAGEKKAQWLKTFRNRIHAMVQNGRSLRRPSWASPKAEAQPEDPLEALDRRRREKLRELEAKPKATPEEIWIATGGKLGTPPKGAA